MRVCLIRKAVIKNARNADIEEIIFYLKSQYSNDNRDQPKLIQNILSQWDVPSFEAISQNLKTISKSMQEDKHMWQKYNEIIKKKDLPHWLNI